MYRVGCGKCNCYVCNREKENFILKFARFKQEDYRERII